jgi:malate synthase
MRFSLKSLMAGAALLASALSALAAPTEITDALGRKVTVELYRQITGEELARLRAQLGDAAFAAGNFERAAKILDQITTADAFETFLTLPASRAID